MSTRWQLTAVTLCMILAAPSALHADIYCWDTGEVIPGTEGITPGPGVHLAHRELEYAELSERDLTGSDFVFSNLTNANLTGANLTNASLIGSALTNANLTEANLTNANLHGSTLTDANLTGAVVGEADFSFTTSFGFTAAQLYSTQSYQAKNLSGIELPSNDLTGWDFREQNLSDADLHGSTLTDANLTGANLVWANLRRSTFTNTNLTGANLTNAVLHGSTLTDANLTRANLRNAYLAWATDLTSPKFSPESVYNQWTVFPEGFNPTAAGLTMVMSPTGDLDANDVLDAADVDMLVNRIGGRWNRVSWLPDAAFDVSADSVVNQDDHRIWVKDLAKTWFGDADLNGEFNSSDFVQVFQAGKYETQRYAGWAKGDWNADDLFNSDDFIIAFQDGGYEQGPRTDVAAVPEPGGVVLMLLALFGLVQVRYKVVQNPPR